MNLATDFTPKHITSPYLIYEEKQAYTKHDQLFKQLIGTFFEEFMEAFFPSIHGQVNFNKMKFLSEEFFTDLYGGDKKLLDLAVEVKWKETDALIVIHVEPQSYKQTNFNDRMFNYFSLLYNRVNKLIIPIAIFTYDDDWEINEFTMKVLDFEILRFNYLTLHLRKQNWRTFIKNANPVSAALLSKMGYREEERIQVKLEFFKILTRLKLDREQNRLLYGFFESYLKLNDKEEEKFMAEVRKFDNADEVFELSNSYEERGKEIGKEIGEKIGRKKVALRMLEKGMDMESIVEFTSLTTEEITKLKTEI